MAEGGSEAFDPVDFRLKRLEADMGEVKADIKALRGEVHAEIGALRTELRDEMRALRTVLGEGIASFRAEIKEELAAVKSEVKAQRADMGKMREDMSYVRGRQDYMPTTIQLLGFIIAIFVASGLTRYFGH